MHTGSNNFAVVIGVLLLCASGSRLVSALCDVDLSGQNLGVDEVVTYSCAEATPTTFGYKVSGNVVLSVYLVDGADCTKSTFDYKTAYSTRNVVAGTTANKLIPASYGGSAGWDAPCIRIVNEGVTAITNLRIQISWWQISFANQFHLLNTGQYFSAVSGSDVNAQPAWNAGATGTGIVVDICDDGLQSNHVEIRSRIRLDLSLNYENNKYNPTGSADDTHGTACGGVAAADGANSYCGKGAAYNAQLAGHRILGFASTNADFADALYNSLISTDVSSNSWGPEGCTSNGCVFYENTASTDSAIQSGALSGREGRGKVYVFAAGNEGHYGGDANQYTETKLREVMAIAGSGYEGQQVFYSNEGANVFTNSPTQGQYTVQNVNPGIITAQGAADSSDQCRDDFGGTSSSTPLVAGVIAQILSANPKLYNRDVQYVIRSTATKNDPTNASWFNNGAGIAFSRKYGFGRVNAAAAVTAVTATDYKYASPIQTYTSSVRNPSLSLGVTTRTDSVTVPGSSQVGYIEHVAVDVTFSYTPSVNRVSIKLTSPAGTVVDLTIPTTARSSGAATSLTDYPLAARAFWGESSVGTWTVSMQSNTAGSGLFSSWRIRISGAPKCSVSCSGTGQVCGPNNGCVCMHNFVGTGSNTTLSCTASNTCASNPCASGSTCVEGTGSYTCRCPGPSDWYSSTCACIKSDGCARPNDDTLAAASNTAAASSIITLAAITIAVIAGSINW